MEHGGSAPPLPTDPSAPPSAAERRYTRALRGLLDRGGFERTGKTEESRRWRTEHISAYLDAVGRPDRRRTVHIAGSKGKGSTAAMTEAILRATGAHTLLLASPDVHSARERVAIDGRPLAPEPFAVLAERLLADPRTDGWSYFELLTMLGWLAGADAGCDWQVVEVGLGGRLDTTNAMAQKEVCVVTPIDYEHTAILGDTIPAIAAEKAGIIVGPCAVVAAPMRLAARTVVAERAEVMGAALHDVSRECELRIGAHDRHGLRFDLRTPERAYRGLRLPMPGAHQAENAATAVRAAELACRAEGRALPPEAVFDALAALRLPARFEVLEGVPAPAASGPRPGAAAGTWVIDAAHTPLAARRLRETVEQAQLPTPRVWVLGVLEGKDARAIAETLLGPGAVVWVARPDSARAQDPEQVAAACREVGADVTVAPALDAALAGARAGAGRGTVIVTGSLYTAAEARERLLGVRGDRALGLR